MPLSKAFTRTSVNTSIFRANSIVSDDKYQFVAYYDEKGYITFAKRTINSEEWEIIKTDILGDCSQADKGGYYSDAHKVISIGLDGDGYLHMCNDMHATELKYRKSLYPYTCQFGDIETMVDTEEEGVTTYPEFHRLNNGNLLFICRGNGLIMNEYSIETKQWKRRGVSDLIDVDNSFCAYWQLCLDNNDKLYLSWLWRENKNGDPESNHNLYYAMTNDGASWVNSKGEMYSLPINHATAELAWNVPEGSDYMNQTSMAVTENGIPVIATYWRDEDSNIPQYRCVWLDNGVWKMKQVGNRTLPFSLSTSPDEGGATLRVLISRPKIVVDKFNRGLFLFRDSERGERVSLAYCRDIMQQEWNIDDLTDFPVGAWEPSIDEDRWRREGILDVYVQKTYGEGVPIVEPEMAYVLEYRWNE